jgi:hypothetical protein
MSIPVLSNFRARGMSADVVGGKRVGQNFTDTYVDTMTGVIAPLSLPAVPGRVLQYFPAGNTDGNTFRGRRLGVGAVTAAFTPALFAGMLIRRYASPTYGAIPSANTVNDVTTEASVRPGEVVSRAVATDWYFEFDAAVAPVAGGAVFVDNTAPSIAAGNGGRVSASVGVSLTTAGAVFTGDFEQGWDGRFYAGVRIVTRVN